MPFIFFTAHALICIVLYTVSRGIKFIPHHVIIFEALDFIIYEVLDVINFEDLKVIFLIPGCYHFEVLGVIIFEFLDVISFECRRCNFSWCNVILLVV